MTDQNRATNTTPQTATRDQILAADDLNTEEVFVDEWNLTVRVRELTGSERGSFQAAVAKADSSGQSSNVEIDLRNLQVRLCAMTIVDENGNRLFADNELKVLGNKSARALQRVFDVAARLSAISETSVEDAVEKSEATPSLV